MELINTDNDIATLNEKLSFFLCTNTCILYQNNTLFNCVYQEEKIFQGDDKTEYIQYTIYSK